MVTVLQNVDALYWQAAGENQPHVNAVKVSDDVVCVFNSTPLEKYENYRLHLSRWGRTEEEGPDPTPTIYNLIDSLLRFLEINRYSTHNGTQPKFLVDLMPEVYGRIRKARLSRLLLRNGLTTEALDDIFANGRGTRMCLLAQGKRVLRARIPDGLCSGRSSAFSALCLPWRPGTGANEIQASSKDRFHMQILEFLLDIGFAYLVPGADGTTGR